MSARPVPWGRRWQPSATTTSSSPSSSSSSSSSSSCRFRQSPVIKAATVVEWEGLGAWRRGGVDTRRAWGPGSGQSRPMAAPEAPSPSLPPLAPSLVEAARQVLVTRDPASKAQLFHRAFAAHQAAQLPLFPCSGGGDDFQGASPPPLQPPPPPPPPPLPLPARPARPARPLLVASPKDVPGPGEAAGVSTAAHLLLNVTHVELNAIDLACDTLARFAPLALPDVFYVDQARVADDEGRHLVWCLQRLDELGVPYGTIPAHDSLWRGCEASAGDLGARLVVVPSSQEARGLDSGQKLARRLVGLGDPRSAAIVRRIAEEERAHVAVGVSWFQRVCAVLGAGDAGAVFRQRLRATGCVDLATKRSTFDHAERELVGLRREWYDATTWPDDDDDDDDDDGGRALLPLLAAGASPPALLEELRARLAEALAMEEAAAAAAGGQ